MIPLRRLKLASLEIATKEKQPNGVPIPTFSKVSDYNVCFQELSDEVSASLYGANLYKTYRIVSPYNNLEKYLLTKVNNTNDNISKYYIFIDDSKYKVLSVKSTWIDIELV